MDSSLEALVAHLQDEFTQDPEFRAACYRLWRVKRWPALAGTVTRVLRPWTSDVQAKLIAEGVLVIFDVAEGKLDLAFPALLSALFGSRTTHVTESNLTVPSVARPTATRKRPVVRHDDASEVERRARDAFLRTEFGNAPQVVRVGSALAQLVQEGKIRWPLEGKALADIVSAMIAEGGGERPQTYAMMQALEQHDLVCATSCSSDWFCPGHNFVEAK